MRSRRMVAEVEIWLKLAESCSSEADFSRKSRLTGGLINLKGILVISSRSPGSWCAISPDTRFRSGKFYPVCKNVSCVSPHISRTHRASIRLRGFAILSSPSSPLSFLKCKSHFMKIHEGIVI